MDSLDRCDLDLYCAETEEEELEEEDEEEEFVVHGIVLFTFPMQPCNTTQVVYYSTVANLRRSVSLSLAPPIADGAGGL